MTKIGVIEGFFGPQWPMSDRKSYARFLSQFNDTFYIYAPKQDQYLRKKWRETWSQHYIEEMSALVKTFRAEKVEFGVGLSPFGLGVNFSEQDIILLIEKLKILEDLNIDLLGVFFDDMPITDNLAEIQIRAMNIIEKSFSKKIIFCPSYYSYDPILDKVFGPRPEGYIEKIGENLDGNISIAWTGPKVISPVIDKEHLQEVRRLLKRKPFIWENYFANDGPKNCKFLKLKSFSGRDGIIDEIDGIGLNLMNQPQLSKVLFLATLNNLKNKMTDNVAFEDALSRLCTQDFKEFILSYREIFLSEGLDKLESAEQSKLLETLKSFPDPAASEISDWLQGKYSVGNECLTD
jgi:hyaluronoglucosaminidase